VTQNMLLNLSLILTTHVVQQLQLHYTLGTSGSSIKLGNAKRSHVQVLN